MKPGRILSIISFPGSNDAFYQERHEGFAIFDHPIQLDDDEIKMFYTAAQLSKSGDWKELDYATGSAPWYVHWWVTNCDDFFQSHGGYQLFHTKL